jgi:Rrf2 family protein
VLSRSSEYAIRALAYLAANGEGSWVLSRQIGEELGIPSPFLAKILQTLASEGILESQRGRKGGFRLARPAERTSLYEIVEPFDRLGQQRLCVLGQRTCSPEAACPLHETWHATLSAFVQALKDTSLADVGRRAMPGGFPWNQKRPEGGDTGPLWSV